MKYCILILPILLFSCSNEDNLETEEMQEIPAAAPIFDESSCFDYFKINVPQNADNVSAEFVDFEVIVSDSIVEFNFRSEGDPRYSLQMELNRDSIFEEAFQPKSYSIWKNFGGGAGFLYDCGSPCDRMTVKVDTFNLLLGGKISGSYLAPTGIYDRGVAGKFEVAIDSLM